jgi:hypothetical protein
VSACELPAEEIRLLRLLQDLSGVWQTQRLPSLMPHFDYRCWELKGRTEAEQIKRGASR